MQDYRININYAKALFLLADESGTQEEVAKDMRLVNDVCRENRELFVVFANPEVKAAKKKAIMADLFESRVCRETMAFLIFVVRKSRSVNLVGICEAYLELYRESSGIVLSHLTTAQPADSEVRAAAAKAVADHTGKQVELVSKTDASIIGGFALEFDSTMYDARYSSRIAKLRRAFDTNVYESKL